jgi:hypothetical protein
MRSLGVSINDIARLIDGGQTTLADLLDEHRALLVRQRDRLDQLIAALDAATDCGAADVNEHILRRLATTHRDSIGVIGRLSAPLSAPVAAMYADLFDEPRSGRLERHRAARVWAAWLAPRAQDRPRTV